MQPWAAPHMGTGASTINPALILDEFNTLNPAVRSLTPRYVGFRTENHWISLGTAPERLVSLGERAAALR